MKLSSLKSQSKLIELNGHYLIHRWGLDCLVGVIFSRSNGSEEEEEEVVYVSGGYMLF